MSYLKNNKLLYHLSHIQNLAFLRIEVPPLNNNENIFFREICELIISKRFKEVILIGGLDSVLKTDNTTFRYVKTESYTLPAFFNNSIQLNRSKPPKVFMDKFDKDLINNIKLFIRIRYGSKFFKKVI